MEGHVKIVSQGTLSKSVEVINNTRNYTLHYATVCYSVYLLSCIKTDRNIILLSHLDAMNLTVKTLKGGKFTVEVDPSNTVAQVKGAIVS